MKKYKRFMDLNEAKGRSVKTHDRPRRPVFIPLLEHSVMYRCICLGVEGEAKMMQLES